MAFSSQQLTYLKTADQRFTAHVAIFPAYAPTITTPEPGEGTLLAHKPMPLVSPRYSVVANSGEITLYATDSYNRGGAYVGNENIAWVNTGGAGSLVDNEDGTATYTAPAEGSGTNLITMTATNGNGTKDALVYVAYPKTTYDALVAEVASISGSLAQHGWSLLFRVRGDTAAFTIGSVVLLHVEDAWAGTTSTFGGYKYSEGVFTGYVTQLQYFEDGKAQRWLGVELKSSWYKLDQIQLSETMWGKTARTGRFYISDFRPIDALWYLLSETTDFCSRHNCTLFYDTNEIDDFIIGKGTDSKVSLASIVADVMGRGLAIAYTDRYSSLLCIPDPDVRSAEWWGTPTPMYDGSEPFTQNCCLSYSVRAFDVPKNRRLSLIAFDSYKLGIWAASQASAGAQGSEEKIQGLLCDDPMKLSLWCAEKRAQMNKPWDIHADIPLNHTLDICNPLIAIFTSPSQVGGATASGLCWINALSYTPTPLGAWRGSWHIVKNSQGDTGLWGEESGWGGSGQWAFSGSGDGIAPSGWGPPPKTTWTHTFYFMSSNEQFTAVDWLFSEGETAGTWVSGYGWSSNVVTVAGDPFYRYTEIWRSFDNRIVTGIYLWGSGTDSYSRFMYNWAQSGFDNAFPGGGAVNSGTASAWTTAASLLSVTASGIGFSYGQDDTGATSEPYGNVLLSAKMGGYGTDPFV